MHINHLINSFKYLTIYLQICSLLVVVKWTDCNAQILKYKGVNDIIQVKTNDTLFKINGMDTYICFPLKAKYPLPVVMAIHGSGREARSYMPGNKKSVPFYIHQRDLTIKNGFLFVVISNGRNTWGTNKGIKHLIEAYHYVTSYCNTRKRWILWATSAGGISMYRLIREHPNIVDKAMGTFPAYDLLSAINSLKSAQIAWKGISSSSIRKINPANFPESLVNVPILIFHGRDDQVLPVKLHSERLRNDVNSRGGNVKLYIVLGGHSTTNWNVYNDKIISEFLLNCK